LEFKVQHLSEQLEAGGRRRVECVVAAVALGPLVERIVSAGEEAPAVFTGFVAARRAGTEQMIFHVTELELERK
jgi:primosomal replication protein N